MLRADDVIRQLGLAPLPGEGGWFRETWRSSRTVASLGSADEPSDRVRVQAAGRAAGTAILYLLTPDTMSALHRLRFEELWCFHRAEPAHGGVDQWLLDESRRTLETRRLGGDFTAGEWLQSLVPAEVWQGARLAPNTEWALVSTVVAPGFEFSDWELAGQGVADRWPDHATILRSLTALG